MCLERLMSTLSWFKCYVYLVPFVSWGMCRVPFKLCTVTALFRMSPRWPTHFSGEWKPEQKK